MYTPPAGSIHLASKIWLEIDQVCRRADCATHQESTFWNIDIKEKRHVVCPQPYGGRANSATPLPIIILQALSWRN
jgi:hypothetical protein